MCKVFGTNERLIVAETVDESGELEVSMSVYSTDYEYTDTWLNKAEAERLISHLQSVFGIE